MGKAKTLTDIEWVKLAVSDDDARPVLTGIHFDTERKLIEGTDAQRLHVVTIDPHTDVETIGSWESHEAGIYKPGKGSEIGDRINGSFPNTACVIPQPDSFERSPAGLSGDGLLAARALLKGAIAASRGPRVYVASLTAQNGELAWFQPQYLLDALAMAEFHYQPITLYAKNALSPIRIDGGRRVAVVMPYRVDAREPGRFNLDEFLTYAKDAAPARKEAAA